MILSLLLACADTADDTAAAPCDGPGALLDCSTPHQTADYYADVSSRYFDTMDYTVALAEPMPYAEWVARWEWPPWLKLTAYGRENIEVADALLTLFPSIVSERDCRGFGTQPFGRCRVTFYYDDHQGLGCPIYEEFAFNDGGEVTWIEAWSDQPESLPMGADDPWAEGDGVARLSARVPGLGTPTGAIALDSAQMAAAEATDPELADFADRARDWHQTWLDELNAAPDDMWEVGCGW